VSRRAAPLPLRLVLLALVVVFVQIGVFSEVPVFGVDVDLSPLLVAFIGLLCGSTIGALTGFAIGLLIDLLLLQTLGLSSLIFTLIGFCTSCATPRARSRR
jgi:rod shape-determining protein MreD